MTQQRMMRLASDTGWTEAVIYAGKKQYIKRMTGLWWLLVGACIAFIILLFAWKPIERKYKHYRRKYRRRRQKKALPI